MRSSNRLYSVGLVLLVAAFFYGAVMLYFQRYARGDVYAPYSTYRTDPLGTKAFYEALDSMPEYRVGRNVEPLERLVGNRPFTLFINGLAFWSTQGYYVDTEDIDLRLYKAIDDILRRGGRVVISFAPVAVDARNEWRKQREFDERMNRRIGRGRERSSTDTEPKSEPERDENRAIKDSSPEPVLDPMIDVDPVPESPLQEPEETEDSSEKPEDDETSEDPRQSLRELMMIEETGAWSDLLQLGIEFEPLKHDPRSNTYLPVSATRAAGDSELPQTLDVHTSLAFETASDEWNVLYHRVDQPDRAVIVERTIHEGTLVLVADAYLLSNEAMRDYRHPALLAWLAGPHQTVVFDEVTLGTVRVTSLAMLMWKYRLQGFAIALIILAVLYIWKNAQPLVPPFYDTLPADTHDYTGKDSASGFINLLRRSVPSAQLLRTCIAEWEKSYSHRLSDWRAALNEAKAIVLREENTPPRDRDLVRAYREVCNVFSKHRAGR